MITAQAVEMRNEVSLAVENINTVKDIINKIEPGTLVFATDDLYPEWDVTGPLSAQVDSRVGQLMMNHTKGKAKYWLLRDYKCPRT
ncbi:hypothetical protein PI124_g17490 [Phytophthora idaei]|nr:hypothetical protein PI125_g18068 [Phytophthora idaei]KAG3138815.1 hypothetical protein PI126_g16742 [Phytophthora idaei]KAG3237523.1 hypothetical protein PI124_g17490 [Phytophthora idaei]